ncbi:DUF4253 domain-containing protein [Andreprevotia lacus]|nr:DUF4253 domain-containing protein [Andreprevotia lacus]
MRASPFAPTAMLPATLSPKGLLAKTGFADAEYISCVIPELPSMVHAIHAGQHDAPLLWRQLRAQYPASGHWPLLVWFVGAHQSWEPWREAALRDVPFLFHRQEFAHEYEYGRSRAPNDPAQILAHARLAEPRRSIERLNGSADEYPDFWADQLDRLRQEYGSAPDELSLIEAMKQQSGPPQLAAYRVLFDWECRQPVRTAETGSPFWFDPDHGEHMAVLLIPVADPADILAYMHWWGSPSIGSPAVIALLRDWQRQHGAELMCHYGTMLQFNVTRPIQDPRVAFDVAVQLETLGMWNDFRDTAWALLGASHWHLHNRP